MLRNRFYVLGNKKCIFHADKNNFHDNEYSFHSERLILPGSLDGVKSVRKNRSVQRPRNEKFPR